ncbi:MAG: Holliday junction branch migration protein RuvA [Nitrospirae bacterium]|nr:Holliday junction branch migration protein RuvA [Nitrospirota bacterium]
MIAWLNGTLIHKTPQMIILDVNNVGYQVQTSLPTFYALPEIKTSVSLYIYTHVREDAILLFGFLTQADRELFTLLFGVSGIGPKLAITILSWLSSHELIKAVQQEDLAKLSSISGIGKKTAGRMLLELKEKINSLALEIKISPLSLSVEPFEPRSSRLDDVLSALVNLGYNRLTIRPKIENFIRTNPELSVEGLIKESLKLLGQG